MILSSQINTANDFVKSGTKAHNLSRLIQAGFNVPPFICISFDDLKYPNKIFEALNKTGAKEPYVVRSSSLVEDGESESYAGQFTTFLNVDSSSLINRATDCFQSKSKFSYENKSEEQLVQSVIIQEMIDAKLSGVMFTRNPLGIISESVIVVGKGLGNNVVEDKTAVTSYYYNYPDDTKYHYSQEGAPLLQHSIQEELIKACTKLEQTFSKGLDVEFAIINDTLYYLQVRKITTLSYDNPIILDNSNITESYPRISLPLTADFVSRQYSSIFKGVVKHLSGSEKLSNQYSFAFDHMVEHYNGRMYYQIGNWYGVISFLPFSKKIVPIWREMLGVLHDDNLPTTYKISKLQRASVALHTLYYFIKAPKKMKELEYSMQEVETLFIDLQNSERTIEEYQVFYEKIVTLVMNKWDYTLINDMYTFIYTALYRNVMKKQGANEEDLQKAIADVSYLASLQPVKNILNLALEFKNNKKSEKFTSGFNTYIEKYGDRSIGELKLETDTYREKPALLMKQIESYASLTELEQLIFRLEKPIDKEKIKGLTGFFLKRAKQGVEGREKSRMDRTRLFGFARTIFLQAGKLLEAQKRIDESRDVFYLTMEEVFSSSNENYQSIVLQRKGLIESYEAYPTFSRIIFDSKIVQKPYMGEFKIQENQEGILVGIPCSKGKATAKVMLIEDITNIKDVSNKILVTYSTDPGWAFLLASAAGLISEKGSILSHTAIIAREMHVPMIVAVKGAMTQLQNDDEVEIDCSTGFITLISRPNKQ